jgi:hypothetical protein
MDNKLPPGTDKTSEAAAPENRPEDRRRTSR